jgi:amino acid permease
MTSMVNLVSRHWGWQATFMVFLVMYGVYHSYRLYFGSAAETLRSAPLAHAAGAGK